MASHEPINKETLDELRIKITRFGMAYKFALDEISTKVNILKEEFRLVHDYNPIEHVNTRVKSAESLIKKVQRKSLPLSLEAIQENIKDIAGIRIICSFASDIYRISKMIQAQSDIEVVEVKDYIQHPKSNGYQSLHIIMKIPVFMSDRKIHVYVEMQIRTIAMDFWASLEHKIYYKYNKQVPAHLTRQLKEAADTVAELDRKMEHINNEINILKGNDTSTDTEELLFNPREMMIQMLKDMDVSEQ
ncbi:GTP pyrophosphokinase family protein [Bacilli bacterium]|uniref:GTP pyrophosphokinase n=1 Tax=Oceanobacillus caeni TaxID=405946 RepID=UPI00062191B8|nr:GTP pyrophosphokinase [Bacilli bacterium VT-13-104]PZD84875.1 GTP pyrophosphokinase family protein [Bacilli bacterium]PZD86354.1 GTP pyrophosphokinase family protein [Bacilli bacterium]PZD89856.1 GTP pyrophosphokinase family protein [Bacilli bacterium]RCO05366.1 GTP pyrophosphokinase family protein [Bacilli bacterium]